MVPYSYLQYPGYVMPHAMQPVDHRRVCDHLRNFPHSPTCEVTLRQSQQNANVSQKETTCAGAQTEPCDALNKLIECLDRLHAADSSHTSGSVSPLTEDTKYEGGSEKAEAKHDQEEKRAVEEEEARDDEEQSEDEEQSDSSQIQSPSGIDRARLDRGVVATDEGTEWRGYDAGRPSSHSSPARCSSRKKKVENLPYPNLQQRDVPDELPCCILHLPFEKVLSSGVMAPSVTSSSLGSPLSYTYRPPKLAHERLSVLSPSLDELSSHDEVLSTDLDDMELFPTRIYTRGRLSEVASRRAHGSDLCVLYPNRLTCTTCGSHSFTERNRSKTYRYKDLKGSDEGPNETARTCDHCLHSVLMKGSSVKKSQTLLKQRINSAQHREKMQEAHETSHSERFYCEKCTSSPEMSCNHSYRARAGIICVVFVVRYQKMQQL